MNVTMWSIAHIIGFLLCLAGVIFLVKRVVPLQSRLIFLAISALQFLGFLWHSSGDDFLAGRFTDARLFFDIFSMLCLAGAALFICYTIESHSHRVLKPDAVGDISKLNMNSVESAENSYVFKCGELYIIFPQYREIKFDVQKCPSMKDESLTFFATATFCRKMSYSYFLSTALFGRVNPRYHQVSVVGYHAHDGVAYKGAEWCKKLPGAFTFYNGQAHFVLENPDDAIKLAAENGGDGFESYMAIGDGKKNNNIMIKKKRCYRVLTELNGRICIIESSIRISYNDFIQSVLDTGVQNALYLDMGGKSSYSQYRDNQNRRINLFSRFRICFSGWIAFYK